MAYVIAPKVHLFWLAFFLITTHHALARCPDNYCYRVEMCIMEAQVAPQAGGALPLITDNNKLEDLCERGILQKTIDCLQDIYLRCGNNGARKHELDKLFSIDQWKLGQSLLCKDLYRKLVFRDHFPCMSVFEPRISRCILIQTQIFKKAVTDAIRESVKTLHDITCNFAKNIVTCLEQPLVHSCSAVVVDTLVTALHHFLPPACASIPDVHHMRTRQTLRKVSGNPQQQYQPTSTEFLIVDHVDEE